MDSYLHKILVISSKDVHKEWNLKGGGNLILQSSDFFELGVCIGAVFMGELFADQFSIRCKWCGACQ